MANCCLFTFQAKLTFAFIESSIAVSSSPCRALLRETHASLAPKRSDTLSGVSVESNVRGRFFADLKPKGGKKTTWRLENGADENDETKP